MPPTPETSPDAAGTARRRAAPLAPEDRRAAIVEAVMPLVAERGADVTSRELADAAGVAEGTLFRAFGDKACLIGEVALTGLLRASDPAVARADLGAIDGRLPLVDRVRQVIERGQRRSEEAVAWVMVLRFLYGKEGPDERDHGHRERAQEMRSRLIAQQETRRTVVEEALERVLAQELDRLRVPIEVAVSLIEAATAHHRPGLERMGPPLPADVLADALVHGIVGEKRSPDHDVLDNHDWPNAEYAGDEAAAHHSEEV
ncbi:TetR/AcrR family transcriptional regulator [Myceligenerans xiligouense]|uniref:TetR family transcriptional regulator n=1 Tax=Myceligenerans xiligouense TaxID=253184 RepID=A0A3N4YQX3_9MICO|nr:TetR/AcrR family transcriptional regulator [Myceligenerans xiligouense]RPF21764.1 TetR family transcriptional regulator [Myceligenerans xiligouense]